MMNTGRLPIMWTDISAVKKLSIEQNYKLHTPGIDEKYPLNSDLRQDATKSKIHVFETFFKI